MCARARIGDHCRARRNRPRRFEEIIIAIRAGGHRTEVRPVHQRGDGAAGQRRCAANVISGATPGHRATRQETRDIGEKTVARAPSRGETAAIGEVERALQLRRGQAGAANARGTTAGFGVPIPIGHDAVVQSDQTADIAAAAADITDRIDIGDVVARAIVLSDQTADIVRTAHHAGGVGVGNRADGVHADQTAGVTGVARDIAGCVRIQDLSGILSDETTGIMIAGVYSSCGKAVRDRSVIDPHQPAGGIARCDAGGCISIGDNAAVVFADQCADILRGIGSDRTADQPDVADRSLRIGKQTDIAPQSRVHREIGDGIAQAGESAGEAVAAIHIAVVADRPPAHARGVERGSERVMPCERRF